MLTQEQLKERFKYNQETGEFTFRHKPGRKTGTLNNGRICIGIDGKIYKAHRLAWLYVHGVWPLHQIDHINGVPTDNRIKNLREATQFQNMQNLKGPNKRNSTELLGVTANKVTGKYKSTIRANGYKVHLGTFDTAEEAHIAYMAVKRNLHPFNTL